MKTLNLQLTFWACLCSFSLSAQFAAGDGTSESPFQIQNKEQLAEVTNNLSAHFILMNDIDLTGETWNQIGSFDQPFSGVFDGNGHKISGATITSSASYWSGFFGYMSQGTIKNLHLKDLSLTGHAVVGGLVGQIDNGIVKNCIVEGTVTSFNNTAGGIVGCIYNGGGSIINCIANVAVTTAPASLTAGAIVGQCNDNGIVQNCLARGSVSVGGRGAGAMGYFGCDEVATPQNTVTGIVILDMKVTRQASCAGPEHFSRIIGTRNGTAGTIANNYVWAEQFEFIEVVPEQVTDEKRGIDKTESELKQQTTYETLGYAFGDNENAPWTIKDGQEFPTLWYYDGTPTSMRETEKLTSIKIFPNPVSDQLQISGNIESAEIYSASGNLVSCHKNRVIEVSNLPAGIYFIKIFSGKDSYIHKFVKR